MKGKDAIEYIAENVKKDTERIIRDSAAKNAEICLLEGFLMRYEEDGRVISYSPVTGRVVVMNPTMGIIVRILKNHKCIRYMDLLSGFAAELKAAGMTDKMGERILSEDLLNAVNFLFLHGYINIGKISIVELLEEYAKMKISR